MQRPIQVVMPIKYDMRKFDVEVLKDTLDAQYESANLILLGDYNDDVDFTVSSVPTTVSTYEAYVNDSAQYKCLKTLSEQGFRSYATFENMIDHIPYLMNLLTYLLMDQHEFIMSFMELIIKQLPDHFPVSARLQLKALSLDGNTATNITCNGGVELLRLQFLAESRHTPIHGVMDKY
jgi:hypothetical protein